MPMQIECPGCRATLVVDDAMAGKQGKCIHCGQRLVVPAKGGLATAAGNKASVSNIGSLSPTLVEATPEAMARELFRRQQSAMLLVFKPSAEGSYDLADVADADLKCIVTEDINPTRFAQLVAGITKRFGPRKKGQAGAAPTAEEVLFELKGDRLGSTLDEFKQKYARTVEGSPQKLPICSDTAWGPNKASLRTEPWHRQAGIVHARIDLQAEDNSPTVAGVKTDILLYQFVDGRLFGILAEFPTDKFHMVSDAAIKKYGPWTGESQKPRQLVWENAAASVVLTRGSVHPVEASTLYVVHKQLSALAEARTPTGAADI
jgi:ribosomal protein S27E